VEKAQTGQEVMNLEIQWLGTAGFKISTREACFLTDPYLSRNADASPCQHLAPSDLRGASHIFISHGHFDHILDIPAVVEETGACVVCSPTAAHTLSGMGVPEKKIRPVDNEDFEVEFNGIKAGCFYSRHIRFDLRLMVSTIIRAREKLSEIIPLFLDFPCGQVLGWRFEIENRSILFFGSGGSTTRELQRLGLNWDILLLPLQGHSRICDKALTYVDILRPGLVIPHHQDDFFPPLSQTVDITQFTDQVAKNFPETKVIPMDLNETVSIL
ncbi:MAG: MBL fold metallo-hydrolase, partial [Desulfobacterium sp.]|nr:MBL fold metallo-hydrolase [Desulfobacterium sp.]